VSDPSAPLSASAVPELLRPKAADNGPVAGPLRIRLSAGHHGPVIHLSGEADLLTAPQLTAALAAQAGPGASEVTVDLSGLWFADSSSLRALILADRDLRAGGGRLLLVSPQPAVARAITLLGLGQMLA
jgi:anti-anti-sigma factor